MCAVVWQALDTLEAEWTGRELPGELEPARRDHVLASFAGWFITRTLLYNAQNPGPLIDCLAAVLAYHQVPAHIARTCPSD